LCASITARDLTQNVARLGVIEFGSKALSRQLALAPSCAPLARGRRRLRLKFPDRLVDLGALQRALDSWLWTGFERCSKVQNGPSRRMG